MSVAEALRSAAIALEPTSDTARLDAELLMAHALGMTRSDMLLRARDAPVPAGFSALVERRSGREPLAYIIGSQGFYGREFRVTSDVLIPRPDSEILIDHALQRAGPNDRILDLGTGSGALILTLLAELPAASGIALDASAGAIAIARENAHSLGLDDRIELVERDWNAPDWSEGLGRFDCIICNPPYVESEALLEPDVRDHEPAAALFAGADGLDDYRVLIPQLSGLMTEGARIIFEIGHTQSKPVAELAEKQGFRAQIFPDLANRPRCVILW